MRNMSFALTTGQAMDGIKGVTRRLGWLNLKLGDLIRRRTTPSIDQSPGIDRVSYK